MVVMVERGGEGLGEGGRGCGGGWLCEIGGGIGGGEIDPCRVCGESRGALLRDAPRYAVCLFGVLSIGGCGWRRRGGGDGGSGVY